MEIILAITVLILIYYYAKFQNKKETKINEYFKTGKPGIKPYNSSFETLVKKTKYDSSIYTDLKESSSTIQRKILKKEDLDKILHFEPSTSTKGEFLIFDIETTGLIKKKSAIPEYEPEKFPYIVQLSWILLDRTGKLITKKNYLIKQKKKIPPKATSIHKITTEKANAEGVEIREALLEILEDLKNTNFVIAHNLDFDWGILIAELTRNELEDSKNDKYLYCTMEHGKDYCMIPGFGRHEYKFPTLKELFRACFFSNVKSFGMPEVFHSAEYDTLITAKCFFKLIEGSSYITSKIRK